jgi:DNA polymerase III gamma/tau subunit
MYYKNIDDSINNNILCINLLNDNGINYYRNEIKTFCKINNKINSVKKTIIIDDLDLLNEQYQPILLNLIVNYKNINFIITSNDINKINENIFYYLELIKIIPTDIKFIESIYNKIVINENIVFKNKEIKYRLLETCNNNIPLFINNINKIIIIYNKNIENIDIKKINFLLSNITNNDFNEYFKLCNKKNYKASFNYIIEIYNRGFSVIDILDEMFIYLKYNYNFNEESRYKIIKLITYYINIFNNLHEENIELLFLTNSIIKILNE